MTTRMQVMAEALTYLKKQQVEKLHVLTAGPLVRSHECVDLAYKDVCTYIFLTEIFADHLSEMPTQLDPFLNALHHNKGFFTENLQS